MLNFKRHAGIYFKSQRAFSDAKLLLQLLSLIHVCTVGPVLHVPAGGTSRKEKQTCTCRHDHGVTYKQAE